MNQRMDSTLKENNEGRQKYLYYCRCQMWLKLHKSYHMILSHCFFCVMKLALIKLSFNHSAFELKTSVFLDHINTRHIST